MMTIACAILILTEILQNRRNKRLTELLEIYEDRWQKIARIGKVYRRIYKYINIENAGDNSTLNRTAEMYHNEGFNLDREKSTDRLLVFVKKEEVKEE